MAVALAFWRSCAKRRGERAYICQPASSDVATKFGKAVARLRLMRRNMDLQSVTLAKVLAECAQFLGGSLEDVLVEGGSWKVSLGELPRVHSSAPDCRSDWQCCVQWRERRMLCSSGGGVGSSH